MTFFLNKDRDRRKDFLDSFDQIIDFVLKEKPDLFLISGDIFDDINPRNPVRNHVIKQFKQIYNNKIKIFAISGNHDEPRSIEYGLSPISILHSVDYLDLIQTEGNFFGKRELTIDNTKLNIFGENYNVFCTGEEDPLEKRKFPKIEGDINIFLVHGCLSLFKYSILGDSIIKEANIPQEIDYVAGGHVHDHMEKTRSNLETGTKTHLVYPGSIEYLTFNEDLSQPKGFMFLEFSKEEITNKEFIKLKTRPIKQLEISISSQDNNIFQKIIESIKTVQDKELILKIMLNGKIKTDQIPSIKQNKLVDYGDQNFFKLFIDTFSKLRFESSELMLPDKEHITPKEAFIYYADELIKKETNSEKIRSLKSAKNLCNEKLEKYGVE